MSELFKPGEKCQASGQYIIVDPSGNKTGDERTVVKGEPFPPTPRSGEHYKLVDKTKHTSDQSGTVRVTGETFKPGEKCQVSGQYIIVNPEGMKTGDERTVVKGEPFPPTPQSGERYKLVDKTKH